MEPYVYSNIQIFKIWKGNILKDVLTNKINKLWTN